MNPTPHGDRLHALLNNLKLPSADADRVRDALKRYKMWVSSMNAVDYDGECNIEPMINLLNDYKTYVDLELIFDSKDDFLYRQKGQLKLVSSIIEEFMPHMIEKVFYREIKEMNPILGPRSAFSDIIFNPNISASNGGGMSVKEKDHDFVIAHPLFIKTSREQTFVPYSFKQTNLPYVVAEIKTNLDKTMFQEANATSSDLKTSVPNSKYFIIAEWLDMKPVNTASTAIESVLILRGRRMPQEQRNMYNTAEGRMRNRGELVEFLENNPIRTKVFSFFIEKIKQLFEYAEDEKSTIERGWF